MTGEDGSDIAQAVAKLHAARESLDEARLHLVTGRNEVSEVRVLLRAAFGDSDHGSARRSFERLTAAESRLYEGLVAMQAIDLAVRDYARFIAPGLSVPDSNSARPTLVGADLLARERRPRNIRELRKLLAEKQSDVVDIGRQTTAVGRSIESLLRKPEDTGSHAGTPRLETAPTAPSGVSATDATSSVVIAAIFVADAYERIRRMWRRKQ